MTGPGETAVISAVGEGVGEGRAGKGEVGGEGLNERGGPGKALVGEVYGGGFVLGVLWDGGVGFDGASLWRVGFCGCGGGGGGGGGRFWRWWEQAVEG